MGSEKGEWKRNSQGEEGVETKVRDFIYIAQVLQGWGHN